MQRKAHFALSGLLAHMIGNPQGFKT